jgi:hypothetical protein
MSDFGPQFVGRAGKLFRSVKADGLEKLSPMIKSNTLQKKLHF